MAVFSFVAASAALTAEVAPAGAGAIKRSKLLLRRVIGHNLAVC